MSKRKETLQIEEKLHYMCHKRRIYGCEEVTIGFAHNGLGNEIVDFCTMDSKGILKCYEIKVTLSDLKSKAKKSWYGHYNYLFVTEELYKKIHDNIHDYIPDYVGVAVPCSSSWSDGVEIRIKATKQELSSEQALMMKESMIRSMGLKIQKYRNDANFSKASKLHSDLRKKERECDKYYKETTKLRFLLDRLERILRHYYNKDIDIEEIVENINDKKILLPEYIFLRLNDRGKKANKYTAEDSNAQDSYTHIETRLLF